MFLSGFFESCFPFSKYRFYQEEFIVYVVLTLLFCIEFIDFGFQVSIWNFDFNMGVGIFKANLAAESVFLFLYVVLYQYTRISLEVDIVQPTQELNY